MPDEQGKKNPKSIDERLDALTMNFELREAQWQHESQLMRELRESVAELRASDGALRESVAELRESVADLRNTLVPAIEQLLQVALSHERRIERLEKRAG